MGADIDLSFDYMHKNELCTHVEIMTDMSVRFENYTDDITKRAFGNAEKADMGMVTDLFESRCFERGRADMLGLGCDCKNNFMFSVKTEGHSLLAAVGLEIYEPMSIVMVTHGVLIDDLSWIRFSGEKLTWEEVSKDIIREKGV